MVCSSFGPTRLPKMHACIFFLGVGGVCFVVLGLHAYQKTTPYSVYDLDWSSIDKLKSKLPKDL